MILSVYILLVFLYQTKSSDHPGQHTTIQSISHAEYNNRNARKLPVIPNPNPFTSSSQSRSTLPAIFVSIDGTTSTTHILKQQLANELGLPLRDLRIVDPSFPSQIQATFLSRKKAILFCIENIKVVVQYNQALVFSPDQEEAQEFIPALQQQLTQVRYVHIHIEKCSSI